MQGRFTLFKRQIPQKGCEKDIKCLNYQCDNELPEYRVKKQRQKNTISKKFFCVPCLKHKHHYIPIFFRCFGIDCDELIEFKGGLNYRTLSYCSTICKNRRKFGTRPSEIRECINCGNKFKSHFGDVKYTCSRLCINKIWSKKRKEDRRIKRESRKVL